MQAMLDTKGNTITYFGHATFSLTTASGSVGIVDPFITNNPRCPKELKKVSKVDVIFVTHGHGDHLGDVVELAKEHQAKVVGMPELCGWLATKGPEKQGAEMNKGGTQRVGEFSVTMTNAFHSGGIEDGGHIVYGGEAAGFIIRMPGGFTIYHAGDTCVFGDMKLIGELYAPDLALLPIGDHYTMGAREAAYAVKLLGVKDVVPMHYATFPVLAPNAEEFKKACAGIAGLRIHALEPGESLGAARSAGGRAD
jgi:L-ascorbate metabolism protein UlaG (beta-lactamase superfamily)